MMLLSLHERLKQIQNEFAKNTERTDSEIVEVFMNYLPQWYDCIGRLLNIGQVVQHNGIKYRIMQPVLPMESQPPDGDGMLAIYKPYRDGQECEWLYGEYIEIGWVRYVTDEDGNVTRYRAIQDPNANIYSPELVPGIWQAQ